MALALMSRAAEMYWSRCVGWQHRSHVNAYAEEVLDRRCILGPVEAMRGDTPRRGSPRRRRCIEIILERFDEVSYPGNVRSWSARRRHQIGAQLADNFFPVFRMVGDVVWVDRHQ
jgi:hypothetical protein